MARTTKIILSTDVPHLGEEGDACEVAPGYARNYLLAKGLASLCTRAALNDLKTKQERLAKKREEKRRRALSYQEKLNQISLEFPMHAGESGHLFGAVNSMMISEKLAAQGIQIERRHLEIPGRTIKEVGSYTIHAKLYDGEADFTVTVIGTDGHGQPLDKQEQSPNPDEPGEGATVDAPAASAGSDVAQDDDAAGKEL